MTTTRSAAALAAACLAVLAGCASHSAAPGADATRSPGTSTTAAPSAPASTPATTAPRGEASAPRCHASQLSMAFTGLNAAMGGQRGMTLILTNHSGSTCYVYGYPGLAFFSGSRIPLSTHLTWLQEPRSKVMLRPGGNAQAPLTWRVSMDPPTPLNPAIVHITPPGEHAYLRAIWPGGPVRGGNIAVWPLSAAPAGPFPAGTGTVASVHRGGQSEMGDRPGVLQRLRAHRQHRDRRRAARPRRQRHQRHQAGYGTRPRRPDLPLARLLPPLPGSLTRRQARLRGRAGDHGPAPLPGYHSREPRRP